MTAVCWRVLDDMVHGWSGTYHRPDCRHAEENSLRVNAGDEISVHWPAPAASPDEQRPRTCKVCKPRIERVS